MKTTYSCTISLTPTSGDDQRIQSKVFSFTTPNGQLVITSASVVNRVLSDGSNESGIVFNNQDNSPLTITGLSLDVSYNALNVSNGPLVLRLLDPKTNKSLFDYHLENAPKDPSADYTNTQQGITAAVSFPVAALQQKALTIQVLGVQKMLMPNTTPSITVFLRGITTDRSDISVRLRNSPISWSCVVALNGYNANATSDAFAMGDACRN